MYRPVMGWGESYECCKCGEDVSFFLPYAAFHDWWCWSLSTALYNAFVRVFRPRYFLEEVCGD